MQHPFVIEGFDLLSKQDIFNLAVAHIGTTRAKSSRVLPGQSVAGCFYGGSGCNAAPLIRPECREQADNSNDQDTGWVSMVKAGILPPANMTFIGELQGCHDDSDVDAFMPQWKERMGCLARLYGLDTTALDAIEA